MALQLVTSVYPGISLYVEASLTVPSGAAAVGSLCVVRTSGSVTLWINRTGLSGGWVPFTLDSDGGDGALSPSYTVTKTYATGAGQTTITLPARVGGWLVTDAMFVGAGAGGGNVQLLRGADSATITDNPASPAANAVTRATSLTLANAAIASGGTVLIDAAAGSTGGTAILTLQGL